MILMNPSPSKFSVIRNQTRRSPNELGFYDSLMQSIRNQIITQLVNFISKNTEIASDSIKFRDGVLS